MNQHIPYDRLHYFEDEDLFPIDDHDDDRSPYPYEIDDKDD